MRCHVIIDNSASMHYPLRKKQQVGHLNKIGFSAIAAASLGELLKRQRDAIGLSVYSDTYEYYAPEKGSDRHRKMILHELEKLLKSPPSKATETYQFLHEIAEKIHRRSLIFLFTDMLQTTTDHKRLFDALRHLKYNKHEVVLFHTYDRKYELDFDFGKSPKKFVDVETGQELNMYAENIQKKYKASMEAFFKEIKMRCLQYKIDYVPVSVDEGFSSVLSNYIISRKKFL